MKQYSDFVSVTHINEELKQIVSHSRRIYMAALNAMLITRKITASRSGFSSVTRELQSFSQKLELLTFSVEKEINILISNEAQLLKIQRITELCNRTFTTADINLSTLRHTELLNKLQLRQEMIEYKKDQCRKNILLTLKSLEKHCDLGGSLAILAKVESTTGEAFAKELTSVSIEIEDVIFNIHECISRAMRVHAKAA